MIDNFTVQLTEKHYLHANRLHMIDMWLSKAAIVSFSALFALYVIVAFAASYFKADALTAKDLLAIVFIGFLAAAGVVIFLSTLGFLTLSFRTKRLFEQQKLLQDLQNYAVHDEAITVKTEHIESTLPFEFAHKWVENSKVFLIYHADNSFQILPTEIVPADTLTRIRNGLIAADRPGRRI